MPGPIQETKLNVRQEIVEGKAKGLDQVRRMLLFVFQIQLSQVSTALTVHYLPIMETFSLIILIF